MCPPRFIPGGRVVGGSARQEPWPAAALCVRLRHAGYRTPGIQEGMAWPADLNYNGLHFGGEMGSTGRDEVEAACPGSKAAW